MKNNKFSIKTLLITNLIMILLLFVVVFSIKLAFFIFELIICIFFGLIIYSLIDFYFKNKKNKKESLQNEINNLKK